MSETMPAVDKEAAKQPRRLVFGYDNGLPPVVAAAWGARAIYERDGSFSLVWDRQSVTGDRKASRAICDLLDKGGLLEAQGALKRLHEAGLITPRDTKELVLVDQLDGLIVKANPQGSCGYIYLVAYMQGPTP